MTQKNDSAYGWFIIALGVLTNIAISLSYMCMPVLFNTISVEFNLSLTELGIIWGSGGLGAMIMSPFGGVLGDRYGTKNTILAACIMAGITGALRAFSPNYYALVFTMFLFGFTQTTIALNVHKTTGVWFTGPKVVIANGIICTSMGAGQTIAAMISDTVMSPMLGGWRNVLIFYGAILIVVGLIWSLTRHDPVHKINKEPSKLPAMNELFSAVLKSKRIWQKAMLHMFFLGSFMALTGFLSLYLRKIGWTPVAADGALALLNAAGMVAAIPLTILAGNVKSKKKIVSALMILDLVAISILPFVDGSMIWILIFLFGIVRDGYFAIITTMVIETEGIGARYSGTAIGLVFFFGNLGVFFISAVGNSLANVNLRYAFALWAIFIAVSLVILRYIKEPGHAEPVEPQSYI